MPNDFSSEDPRSEDPSSHKEKSIGRKGVDKQDESKKKLPTEDIQPSNKVANNIKDPEYVVGVGASAGGLEALESLFECMPFNTNMAFVVIQHLSPDYKSMMAELLNRKTMIPIVVATDNLRLQANTIYLLPPAKEMIVANNSLYLSERENKQSLTLPINTFFHSLGESYGDKSIAIVLSGSGSDGSQGSLVVHDNGGFVIAQEPKSCKFDAMPNSLIATTKVDIILAPEDIPDVLIKYSKRTNKIEQHMAVGSLDAEENQFSEIIILLNNHFDLDFSQYKPSTITRRLERRLVFQKVGSLREYMSILLSDRNELDALYCDLLIGVSSFFRDELAYRSLGRALPKLFKDFVETEQFRFWVAACSSGQEAYSMSILLHEALQAQGQPGQSYKIFATDMHQTSIDKASSGRYAKDELVGLSDEQIEKYFTEVSPGIFQVEAFIRRPIVFAQHNILKDAPFTNMHMASCRNVLIYFNAVSQQRALSLLSFALRTNGLLFLGTSETLGKRASDFKVIDETNKVYRKSRETSASVDLNIRGKLRTVKNQSVRSPGADVDTKFSSKSKKALEALLQKHVPPSVLIDSEGLILHVFGDVGKFLSLEFGSASLNIRSMVSGQARVAIVQMLSRVKKTGQAVESKNITGFVNFDDVTINMHTLSNSAVDREYIIVSLSAKEAVVIESDESQSFPQKVNDMPLQGGTSNERFRELEEELEYTKESLQTTVEELESSNEELQATNEELMASNEEMQSTNEELQSVNEELFTVNAEFQEKERERNELAADEKSIIEASGIGIVFLDKKLNIRKFSLPASKLFNLLESDIGRSFTAMNDELVAKVSPYISKVFTGVKFIEQDFEVVDGSAYHITITDRRFSDEVIIDDEILAGEEHPSSGIIISIIDTTKQRSLQKNLVASEGRFSQIINTMSDGYFEWCYGEEQAFFTQDWLRTMGYEENPSVLHLLGDYFSDFQQRVELAAITNQAQKIEVILPFNKYDKGLSWFICKGEALKGNKEDSVVKFTGILIDFNKYKAAELKQNRQAVNLERSNQLLEQFAHIVSHDLKAPLRHIQNYLRFLQGAIDKGDSEAVMREMAALSSSTKLLEGLIDDIITFSRVNSERKKVAKVNLNLVVEAVLKTLSPIIEEKNILINCEDLDTLPGDKSLFTHLFQNLIGNACKYNDKAQPRIDISCKIEADTCVISFKDNGIGFDESHSANIFTPFKRLVTKDQYEGSGIGLSICKTVVEQHNGHISVTSSLGEGSTFYVSLPLNTDE